MKPPSVLLALPALAPVLAGLALAALSTGCGPTGSQGVATVSPTWSMAGEPSIPGIQSGSAAVVTLWYGPPAGVTMVLWSDADRSKIQSATRQDHAFAEGSFFRGEGSRVDFACTTRDGVAAEVQIAGNRFDTSNGTVFLISSLGAKPFVRQLPDDARTYPTNADGFITHARKKTEVSAFFTEARNSARP